MPVLDTDPCHICQTPPNHHNVGTLCQKCYHRLANTLTYIPEQAADAAAWTPPRNSNSGAPVYGSRPPIPVETIDPELALIELNPGDDSSAVPILEALEMWERQIREERGLTPYGPASLARCEGHNHTRQTLIGVTRFLHANLEWVAAQPDFPVDALWDHVRRSSSILRRWSTDDHVIGTRIACPTQLDDGTCDATITVAGDSDGVYCRRCGRTWTVEWLIRVAGEGADGWADMEAIVRLSGLHERTVRRWARAGKVRKRGLLYSVRDVSDKVRTEIPA